MYGCKDVKTRGLIMDKIVVGDKVIWKRTSHNKVWRQLEDKPMNQVHCGSGKVLDIEDDGVTLVVEKRDGSIISVSSKICKKAGP